MKNDCLQFVLSLTALVISGALEEFLPQFSGVGFPVLLSLSVCMAVRKPLPQALFFALAAGAFEDALSALPTLSSPCFFLAAVLLAWYTRLSKTVLLAAYPIYQLWLAIVRPGIVAPYGIRFLLAIPIVAFTAFLIDLAWPQKERRSPLDAQT